MSENIGNRLGDSLGDRLWGRLGSRRKAINNNLELV
jgi:hypothetical protein